MIELKDKIIVVTGGSGFLGTAFQEHIRSAQGVAINADISCTDQMKEDKCHLDITSEASIKGAVEMVLDKYGRIDGWINNAYPRTNDWGVKFENIPMSSWKKNVDMHMNGYFHCCQIVLEQMKQQKSGSLLNLSSIYGSLGPDFNVYAGTEMTMPAAYAAIKGGIVNLTRYLASYYGAHGVRVNCISPGGVWDHQPESFVAAYNSRVPMGRMAQPNDIAPAAVFLLSDAASYITGHDLFIDGGWSAI